MEAEARENFGAWMWRSKTELTQEIVFEKKSNKNTTSMQLTFVTYGTITWLLPFKLKKPLNCKIKTATNLNYHYGLYEWQLKSEIVGLMLPLFL